ncbi:MAG: aminoglycoside phosphotransferase family protein [Paracoccaceae bacterium]
MPDRLMARRALLQRAGWGDAVAEFLAGDASDRRYERLKLGATTAVLMDAPPGKGDDPAVFLAVADHLLALGLSAPRLIAGDLPHGFVLLEDFGDDLYARLLAKQPGMEQRLYTSALDALARLWAAPAMRNIPDLSARDWAEAAALALTAYRAAATGKEAPTADLIACLSPLIMAQETLPKVMVLRDFHAENLIWLPHRKGAARVGLLDFQLAQMGHPVYDVVSLVQDARRDVQTETVNSLRQQFCMITGQTTADHDRAVAVWGAQRALRIMGVFARLAMQSGKTGYLDLMPRVWGHLQENLRHPLLSDLKMLCDQLLPEPDPAVREHIRQKAKS